MEKNIQNEIYVLSGDKSVLKAEKKILSDTTDDDTKLKRYASLLKKQTDEISIPEDIPSRLGEIALHVKQITQQINLLKAEFRQEIKTHSGIRKYRVDHLTESHIISIFESTLTRTLGMYTNQKYDSLIVIRVYYYDILKQLMMEGFSLNGEKYIFFTASAGQIRTKKVVFVKESLWLKHRDTIMCGLSPESIESKGGTNRNKYLAYLALCNSATDEWPRFNIRKSIIVDDMETVVRGNVDYIDDTTFDVARQDMDVPICHTDGCGIMLPRVSRKNFMVRLPWVKGLLAPFAFDDFVREANAANPSVNHGLVKDIYGEMHDILAEDIEVIFTKSQFKMHAFYDTWNDYIAQYEQNGCTAGICNLEENYIPLSKTNYQVLQTLIDMSDDELSALAEKTVKKIENIATSRTSKLDAFGATKDNPRKNDFQKCLLLYPELLQTPYIAGTLRDIKNSMVKDARAGKLHIDGKYLFIIPDIYAFCEWLFKGDAAPKGLLSDGEVFCSEYASAEKLDCLRSPHLYREHAVRRNVVDAEKMRWFTTAGVYTSCHDLISKLLMCDNDGDKSLVVADPLLVAIAERNMKEIVPLQYKLGKAGATPLNAESLYDGMILAYTGGAIGTVSNHITKIWNSESPDLSSIKILCYTSNAVIDYAKTLYKPNVPAEKQQQLDALTKKKTPHFFIYAKDKTPAQVEPSNDSVVNRLEYVVPNSRIRNKEKSKSIFNYKMLMHNKNIVETKEVVDAYNALYKRFRGSFMDMDENSPSAYIRIESLNALTAASGNASLACDMLIHYLFQSTKSKRQRLFWLCFGDIVYANLERNLSGTTWCKNCGARDPMDSPNQKLCKDCSSYKRVQDKVLICKDCGLNFVIPGIVKNKKRCDLCQRVFDLERYKKYNSRRK